MFLAKCSLAVIGYALWKLLEFAYHQFTSPLRHLRGPKSKSFIFGSLEDIINPEGAEIYEDWARKYGNTMKCKSFFNIDHLFTQDIRAVNHILTHNYDYQKKPVIMFNLAQIFGEGLLLAEASQHRQQRRIMSPAFGPGQIRALTDVFLDKASRLRDFWLSETGTATAGVRIDVVPWLNQTALDAIGSAGFNYDFEALKADGKPNELNQALSTMFSVFRKMEILPVLQTWIPPLRLIPTESSRKIQAAQRTVARIGKELLTDAKAAAQASATQMGEIKKHNLCGRDLLSLLVKANMATDIPENQRMSDEDVLAQVPTFVLAGHETTSVALTWALYALTQAPDVQTKLREELLSVDTDTPSMDDLMALPYLDVVVRETLRLYPPLLTIGRAAMKDDIVPVEKPFTDKHGIIHNAVRVRKGDMITISFMAMNYSRELWGPDAHEFRPERWTQVPEAVSKIPGVWSHIMTFGCGPRGCIGYRFALAEMKATLFTLVRTFEFALAVPASEIRSRASILQRPVLRSDPANEPQLPLLIRPYQKGTAI